PTLCSVQSRALPARNLGQNRLSISIDIGLSSPAILISGEPGASWIDPAKEIDAPPARMTKREIVRRPSAGATFPETCHSSTRTGGRPNSSTASTASLAFRVKSQAVAAPFESRTGRTSPLTVALLFPQASVEG